MNDTAMPIPPPTFEFLVLSIKMQAEMQLGLMNFGAEEEPQADLAGARHAIDMLGMLQAKTKGNLSMEEQRLIENALTELRFRFVQVSQAPPKPAESIQDSAKDSSADASKAAEASTETSETTEAGGESPAETSPETGAKKAAAKEAGEKPEESETSSSGIRVTDRRSGKSSTEE